MPRPNRRVQFAIAERLAHLDVATWDALTKDAGVFMRRPFLSALEASAPDNVCPRYALMYLDQEPIAALALQVVRIEGRLALASPFAQLVDERALVFGNFAASGETGLVIKPGADVELVWSQALELVDRLRRFEKSEGVINVAFVKDAAREEDERGLRKQGYQRAPAGPDMQLRLDPSWGDLNGYLASLASKRRRAARKVLEDVTAAGYGVRRLHADELELSCDRLDALYGQVWANADVRPLRLSGRFFVALQRALNDDCAVYGLERAGQLDGFVVALRSHGTCVGYYLGFDKSVKAPLYLRLLVAILEQGIAWRCELASLGRTAEEPKSRLGAVPIPGSLWVRHRTPPLNWAVGAILGSIEAPVGPQHRVFRQDAQG